MMGTREEGGTVEGQMVRLVAKSFYSTLSQLLHQNDGMAHYNCIKRSDLLFFIMPRSSILGPL